MHKSETSPPIFNPFVGLDFQNVQSGSQDTFSTNTFSNSQMNSTFPVWKDDAQELAQDQLSTISSITRASSVASSATSSFKVSSQLCSKCHGRGHRRGTCTEKSCTGDGDCPEGEECPFWQKKKKKEEKEQEREKKKQEKQAEELEKEKKREEKKRTREAEQEKKALEKQAKQEEREAKKKKIADERNERERVKQLQSEQKFPGPDDFHVGNPINNFRKLMNTARAAVEEHLK
ncbi:predicted protein [Naegleria gruberi]|uniref:Predicted protein n=1 Tax=Naegleria gruberi TaxID=5762 RepID=D2VBK1_NAEGR|nr:uncharacterized protein NAEGRDRAFT_66245 [Naegleria gruberi]EFC45922.1 predicted protein [Naegleria gruberi]|eukprot:XP_002678666.1 predicted protein [Naegleria gruberi strain NEG-M]